MTYQRGDVADFAADIAAVGIGDQFGFFRVSGARAGDGVQLGIAFAVFARFDLSTPSCDLLNADYILSLPLTFRRGGFSGRLRLSHQSSHLGDEFLLRPETPERENLSFESAALMLSRDMGPLRVYAGGEYFFNRDPVRLLDNLVHTGELSGRRWSILAEFYDGPSPYGQFHRSDIRLTGVGFHFTL